MSTTTSDLLHRICPMKIGNDDYNTDLASAKEHSVFKSLIYSIIWVSRNQEGNGYMNVSSLLFTGYTGKFLASYLGSSKGRASIVEEKLAAVNLAIAKADFNAGCQRLRLCSSFQWQF